MGHSEMGSQEDREFALREGADDDVPCIADMHRLQIAEGFLSTLGAPFLRRLYRRIIRSPFGFLIVAHEDGQGVAGFVAGTTDTGRLYRQFLVRDGVTVCFTSGPRLGRSVPKVIETLRYGSRDERPNEPELLALAVDEAWRRRGVGTALVEAFLSRATASGASSARVVVGARNAAAVQLYRRSGFEPQSDLEVHRGTASQVMRTNLPGCTGR